MAKLTQRFKVACGVLVIAVVYGLLLVANTRSSAPSEWTFDSPGTGRPLNVLAELVSVNATRGTAQLQFSSDAERDVVIDVGDAHSERDVRQNADFTADLDGTVAFYPADQYATEFHVRAHDAARVLPLHLTMREELDDWNAYAADAGDRAGAGIALKIRRPVPAVFFGVVIYLVMALVASSALAIATLVYLRKRKIEATLIGALAGMLFALPAMRGALPGAPPLGVTADVLIFLWAEVAVAVALSLFVWSWATTK
jgi:hypothetical protein